MPWTNPRLLRYQLPVHRAPESHLNAHLYHMEIAGRRGSKVIHPWMSLDSHTKRDSSLLDPVHTRLYKAVGCLRRNLDHRRPENSSRPYPCPDQISKYLSLSSNPGSEVRYSKDWISSLGYWHDPSRGLDEG